ncbi:hypothetical protein KIN20_006977 [Parelaphostrongylus tenuis]|uniref:Uncharacterized protein n=1 Tax=Parelaphostrongylus tenuis TaxID=148309 RepID=A0AAD5QIS1_PARTN|nr:hypothetical protein KIN20_006977 [Parelaphostrongylus tenuis]
MIGRWLPRAELTIPTFANGLCKTILMKGILRGDVASVSALRMKYDGQGSLADLKVAVFLGLAKIIVIASPTSLKFQQMIRTKEATPKIGCISSAHLP